MNNIKITANGFIFEEKEYTFPLNEEQREEFQKKVNWTWISEYQKLSEKFIREFQDKVHWYNISEYQKLSEKFIREFQDKVNWDNISQYQKLSEKFIIEFQEKVYWDRISANQKLSEKFRKEFNLVKINKPISIKEYAKEHNLEIKDGYLYAFRDHNMNGSGIFRKNIYYEKGKTYRDWHCDLNPDHGNSFGLGVFPKGNTAVRVKIEDWGTGVKDSNKGRVWEFEVL